jgi:hypothetical protein
MVEDGAGLFSFFKTRKDLLGKRLGRLGHEAYVTIGVWRAGGKALFCYLNGY